MRNNERAAQVLTHRSGGGQSGEGERLAEEEMEALMRLDEESEGDTGAAWTSPDDVEAQLRGEGFVPEDEAAAMRRHAAAVPGVDREALKEPLRQLLQEMKESGEL